MGMYTEIYINVDLKEDTPAEVIQTLEDMCEWKVTLGKPLRWAQLFFNGSCYTPRTNCALLTQDHHGRYVLEFLP
jgi:hypothetical protein